MTVNTDAYLEFVNAVTSQPSKDADAFEYRIQELRGEGFETHRLLTASCGMLHRHVWGLIFLLMKSLR